MALKSTIYKAQLAVADIDHGYYADHALTLARHPSETDERMMVRLAALAVNAHPPQGDCGGGRPPAARGGPAGGGGACRPRTPRPSCCATSPGPRACGSKWPSRKTSRSPRRARA